MSPSGLSSENQPYSLLIGGVTGIIVGITLQPLEILKTNLIINPNKSSQINRKNQLLSTMYTAKEVFEIEGLRGFWRGLLPALAKLSISSALYFSTLSTFESALSKVFKKHKNQQHFLSSALARVFSGILTNPIQVVRTRFEVVGFSQYNNTFDAFYKIYLHEGWRGFTTGLWATALRDAPFAGIYFTIYLKSKRFMEEKGIQWSILMKSFCSGILAGIIATILTNPFDVIRARMQYGFYIKEEKERYKGVCDGFRKIYINEGANGFLKGMTPRLMRKPLSNSLSFLVYEWFYFFLSKKEAF